MIEESNAHAADDMELRALTEARVEAERLVDATEGALEADADLLDQRERAGIDAALAAVRRLAAAEDRHALTAGIAALNRATEDFAARRMDRSVARALTGRKVDTLAGE
jgi:molecular chaperone HscA